MHADNTATVYLGKGEFGQGNTTGLLQIAGEELDLDMSQLKWVQLDTNVTPNQGATTSSSSIHRGGPQLRAAAAEARQALLALASTRLGVQAGSLVVSKGVVSIDGHPTQSVTYGALIGDKPFNVKFTGTAPQKPINRYTLVGSNVPRVDIPDKAGGTYLHMQHVRLPGMLHGRVVRPRGQRAYGAGAKPVSIDESSIKDIPARIVRKGDFLGVVAEREWDAVKAARALKVTWQETPALPGHAGVFDYMRAAKTTDTVIADWGDAAKAFAQAAHVASASYRCPYQSHAPFGPNCALADVGPGGALVMSSTQDIYNSRAMLAEVLGLPVNKVRVQYHEGSGTFGRSCYEDAAQAAAVMSQAVGKPVRVQFMRSDEHGWDDYGPAHLADVRAGIDAGGKLVAYEYHGWQHGWLINETTHELTLLTPAEGAHQRPDVDPGQPDEHRLDVHGGEPARGQPRGADGRAAQRRAAALAARSLVRVRLRADDRRAGGRRPARSARVPAQEHRRCPLARRAQRRRRGRGLEAQGLGLGRVQCRRRLRARHRARHPPRLLRRGGCRHRGRQAHRNRSSPRASWRRSMPARSSIRRWSRRRSWAR